MPATTLQPASPPRVRILKKSTDLKTTPCQGRFVYIWMNESGTWNPIGLFLTDKTGTLYYVEDDVRNEYSLSGKPVKKNDTSKKSTKLLSNGTSEKYPDPTRHRTFQPKSKTEYFFCFLPVDLLLDKKYSSAHTEVSNWADSTKHLISTPPSHWLKKPNLYGIKTIITSEILATGLLLNKNWLEWLRELRHTLDKLNWYTTYAAAKKQPYIQASVLLDTISDMLEVTAKNADKPEHNNTSYELSRNYALYQLQTYAKLIRKKYLSTETLKKEEMAYMRFSQTIFNIIKNNSFKNCFLYYAVVDKKCVGGSSFSMETQKTEQIPLDPVHFILQERINQILRAAFASLLYEPNQILTKNFYENIVLPAELKLADTLDSQELEEIKNVFSDQKFSDQFLAGCTPVLKNAFLTEINEAIKPLTDENALAILNRENIPLKKAIEDADKGNPVWNWLKDSAQDNIDGFLEIFSTMRESWATEDFGKAPTLKNSWKSGIRRSLVSLRITTAAYKNFSAQSEGKISKIATRSAKGYISSVKNRMLNKDRWIKNDDGELLTSTPANLNMMFSAIGVIVSIQGIYAFSQKCRAESQPEIDDYVDLYKTLSSGASSLIGLMPDAISDSHLVKALATVFKPISAVCDIHSSIKMIKKSQIYYAHRDYGKSIYNGIEVGIKLSNAGFTLATLFRTKWIAKHLLKREVLISAGSKTLSFSLAFAMIGCEAFKWYLKSIEPEASKFAKDQIIPLLDELISVPLKRGELKLETIKITVHGVSYNIPKINNYDPQLMWKDVKLFNGKEIYCDPTKKWDWVLLRKLINDEIAGVPPLLGLGWITDFDDNKAIFDLLDRGVTIDAVAAIGKMKKEEVERMYRDKESKKIDQLNSRRIKDETTSAKTNILKNLLS